MHIDLVKVFCTPRLGHFLHPPRRPGKHVVHIRDPVDSVPRSGSLIHWVPGRAGEREASVIAPGITLALPSRCYYRHGTSSTTSCPWGTTVGGSGMTVSPFRRPPCRGHPCYWIQIQSRRNSYNIDLLNRGHIMKLQPGIKTLFCY